MYIIYLYIHNIFVYTLYICIYIYIYIHEVKNKPQIWLNQFSTEQDYHHTRNYCSIFGIYVKVWGKIESYILRIS